MRYIGNKTKLLGFIRDALDRRGISAGTAVDPFSGTASVSRALKSWGFRVVASDLMQFAYVFGKAYVETPAMPDLSGVPQAEPEPGELEDDDIACNGAGKDPVPGYGALSRVIAYLNRLLPEPGFIHEHFTPAGGAGAENGRMYFTPENAARIDSVRATLHEWRTGGLIDDVAFHLLLASLIEAADAVANTAGVYAACIKSWQPNALRPLTLRLPRIVPGNGCHAVRRDALELVTDLEPFDLLYLDPPYNTRQYPGYYHIPELIAQGWFDQEVVLRGKTGLLPDDDKRSDWCRPRRCEEVFEELVARAPFRHLVMSYNAEGIIPESTIERVLKENGRAGTYRRYTRLYKRYRSDVDGENRRYRGDDVVEYLYCVDR